uniref:4-coumarate--CoA ligase 2 n=1 Tax=Ceratitis capitata TaxID=7213 RepID=W8C6H7_CERCA
MDFPECGYDKYERVWSGGKRPLLYDFDCSLGKVIYNTLKNYPKHVSQVFDPTGREVTNGEMLTWSVRLAQHFKKMGLRHDDVIGIVAKNSTFLSAVVVASLMNCTPFHAVNPVFDKNTIEHIFKTTAPKVIFCDGDFYEKVHSATHALKPLYYTLTDHIEGVAKIEDLLLPSKTEFLYQPKQLTLGGEQTVAILCSSGTTGIPKCVCISNYALQIENIFITSEDVIFTNSCIDWFTGLIFTILAFTISCKRVITNRPYTPEYFVELVKKYKINYVGAAPRYIATLVTCPEATAENLSSIRSCVIGGGIISLTTLQLLQGILKNGLISFGYGLTEIGTVSFNFGHQCPTSVGKLIPNMKVRIVDDNGKNLPHNEVGEVYVNTGRLWNGYYGNPIETQRFRDSLGWFHTGDLGYFDDNNFLYIVDRKKDVIKYQGMQYWPGEIEQVISELPEVEDVCVVGVYDERNGDAAGALVVLRKGADLTEARVKDHVRNRLEVVYKQLHAGVIFVNELPHNANGKLLKREAKAMFESKQLIAN